MSYLRKLIDLYCIIDTWLKWHHRGKLGGCWCYRHHYQVHLWSHSLPTVTHHLSIHKILVVWKQGRILFLSYLMSLIYLYLSHLKYFCWLNFSGMGLQIMQDIAHSHVGATPPRSPSQNSVNKLFHVYTEFLRTKNQINLLFIKINFSSDVSHERYSSAV